MANLTIVAANGGLTLPIGWALPIVVDEKDLCFVHGVRTNSGFPLSELSGFAAEQRVTLLKNVYFDLDIHAGPAEALEYDPAMFRGSIYILYRNPLVFSQLGIDISKSISTNHRGLPTTLLDDDSRTLDIFVISRPTLISALNDICYFLNDQITEILKALKWDGTIIDSHLFGPLTRCTKSYYDVAFNLQHAIRAITFHGMLLAVGSSSHMLSEWLEAACKRWRLTDWSVGTWRRRFDSVVGQITSSSAFAEFHRDAIRREAIKLLTTTQNHRSIKEDTNDPPQVLLHMLELLSKEMRKEQNR